MRVLVVEDEPLIGMLAADILGEAGCEVVWVSYAAAARGAAAAAPFDVAVVDLGLPDGPAASLIKTLLALRPGLGLVLSTGRQPDDPVVAVARRAGGARVAALIGKPWAEGALVAAVRRAAGNPPGQGQRPLCAAEGP